MIENTTVFKRVDMDLSSLLTYIDIGDIGLPHIQRPFVWPATNVRDLFDSMYRGFPVGYLLFWANAEANGNRQIGIDGKAHKVPSLLLIDGQQRLTSLYSVFRGKPVVDDEYREWRIEIAFNPSDERFEVTSAAHRKDPEWVPDISEIWTGNRSSRKIVNEFIENLQTKREISGEEEEHISHNLDRLFDLMKYPFTALEIAPTVDEEQVADIFVRINSKGAKLEQADFILTLLSVFGEDLRKQLEEFSFKSKNPGKLGTGPSPFNYFIRPAPDQLLRVAIALGFYRGRLEAVYPVLRGKDSETGKFSEESRNIQFDKLRKSQKQTLDLVNWHQFFTCLTGGGFRGEKQISSNNALLYAYTFYILGREQFKLPSHTLDRLIARWFYAITLTGRYTSSPESIMEGDLNLIKELQSGEEFSNVLERIISSNLTSDFWTITLPSKLETSSRRSPLLSAFIAAQIKLKSSALFSHKFIFDLLDPSIQTKKKFMDYHHLFPRAWLEKQGVKDDTLINQIANLTFLEWPDNIRIKDNPPEYYVPTIKGRFSENDWRNMLDLHALPLGWEQMGYIEFLEQRRILMAGIIRRGLESL